MSVMLQVPFVTQLNYGPKGSMSDPTGCWYASACMVAYYFEAGPRLGIPELHTSKLPEAIRKGLGFTGHFATGSTQAAAMMGRSGAKESEHELLAKREHLAPAPQCETNHAFTLKELEELLRKQGPIFFYWRKTPKGKGSYGHASVMIGTNDRNGTVIYHDPENAPSSVMKISAFNSVRQQWKYAMMQRTPKA